MKDEKIAALKAQKKLEEKLKNREFKRQMRSLSVGHLMNDIKTNIENKTTTANWNVSADERRRQVNEQK